MISAVDCVAIERLPFCHTWAVDTRDRAGLADCFDENVCAEYEGLGSFRTRAGVIKAIAKAHDLLGPCSHVISDIEIVGEGREVPVTAKVVGQFVSGKRAGSGRGHIARYDVVMVLKVDGWRVTSRPTFREAPARAIAERHESIPQANRATVPLGRQSPTRTSSGLN